jgi:hypothetical protein
LLFGPGPIPLEIPLNHAEGSVGFSQGIVQLECLQGCRFSFRVSLCWRKDVVVTEDVVGIGQAGIALSVGGVLVDGAVKVRERLFYALFGPLIPVVASFQIELVSFRIHLSGASQPGLLLGGENDPDLVGNLPRDLALQ